MQDLLVYTLLTLVAVLWFRWRWKMTSVFRELGIPGPKPSFFFGNLMELYKKGPLNCEKEWLSKYGKVVGYYYGMRPILLVADLDLIKKIYIKDFHYFSDRPETVPLRARGFLDSILPTSKIMDSMLVNTQGQKWKKIRSILSPTFSATKMKLMAPTVNNAIDVMILKLESKAKTGEIFEIYDFFRRLTLDVICQTAFAIHIDVQHNPDDPFLRCAKLMFGVKYTSKLLFFGLCFPEFSNLTMVTNFILIFFANRGSIPPLKVTSMMGEVIKERRENLKKWAPDLLQLMVEASATEQEVSSGRVENGDDEIEEKENGTKKVQANLALPKKKLQLTDLEIKSNALVVFLAGYETTSTALAYAFHFLVKYPDLQEKIRAEVDGLIEKEGELSYSSVNQLQLLDRFLSESMRIYPPVTFFVNRIATADVQYGDLHIPKGMQVQVPVNYIQHSPEYWSEPENFDPDRFLPENRSENFQVTYLPFGIGPRNCLGIRFATLEAKMTVAKLLRRFLFVSGDPDEKAKISLVVKASVTVPDKILVKAYERR